MKLKNKYEIINKPIKILAKIIKYIFLTPENKTIETINALFSKTGILALIGFLLFFPNKYLAVIGWVFMFAAFDSWGFAKVDARKNTHWYRLIQIQFQIILSYILYIQFDLSVMIAANLLWLFKICDLLFHYAWNYPLTPVSWFTLSPISWIFNRLLNYPAPIWSIKLSYCIGITISFLILYYF